MDALKNFAYSTVATAPSPASSGLSLIVGAGHGTRFPAVPFNATIWPTGAVPDPNSAEIVRVTGISTDTLTIVRAQESSSARTVIVGDQIAATITKKTLDDLRFVEQTTTSTGTQNDFAITSPTTLLRCNNATALILSGFAINGAAPKEGDRITVFNVGSSTVQVSNQDAGSTAANRVISPQCQVISAGGKMELVYDSTTVRWRTEGAEGVESVIALTDGATPALDASLGKTFTLAAAGDRTIAIPSNAVTGMRIIIRHLASGGARTLALNTGAGGFRFGSDIAALTQTVSGKTDYIGAVYHGTDSKWDVVSYVKGF